MSIITLDGEALEYVEIFTDLNSIIDEQEGSDADMKARIDKARAEFLQSKNIWNLKQLSANIEFTIINTNVETVLLYGAEISRNTTTIIEKVQAFINSCLLEILNVRLLGTTSNSLPREKIIQLSGEEEIRKRP